VGKKTDQFRAIYKIGRDFHADTRLVLGGPGSTPETRKI